MHLAPLIFDLAIILAVAGFMSLVFQKIRQPVVLGYILAGVIVGPYTPPFQLVKDIPSIQTWAELGVIFLMFTLGLEFSFRKLLSVGLTAGVSAGLEVTFFMILGYGIGTWLGWSSMDSLFLGAMLSISSTTIAIKALEELKLKTHKFAGLIFGILIVEDLFAILLLVGLTTIASSESFSVLNLATASLNLIVITGSWFVTGYFVVPRLITYVGKTENNEMLTLVSIGLCLGLVVLAVSLGYSAALGAFIMGSILAETKIIHQIESLMAPLRDLFGAIFFVSIGMMIDPKVMWQYKETILLLCFITIIGKIFITSFGALITGQSLKNSIQVGLGLAQIGEFSFIIAGLGISMKAISERLYPIAVAVSLITTFTTPYLIKNSGAIADWADRKLPWKFKQIIERYSIWCNHRKGNHFKDKDLLLVFVRWTINGIIVTFIYKFCFKHITAERIPFSEMIGEWRPHLTWLISFLLSLPFIWGMIFTSRGHYLTIRKEKNLVKAIVVLFLPILTSVWIGILSFKYFPIEIILLATLLSLMLIYFLLFKKLESQYKWLEKKFLATFNKRGPTNVPHVLSGLAPWNSHLVDIQVHPNAHLINSSLLKANLRQRFGVNIVAIKRGLHTIIAPGSYELILPADILTVLGNDEQLDKARPELEIPSSLTSLIPDSSNYRLRHLTIGPGCKLTGVSLRDSGIRDRFHATVVGVERSNQRIINPDTDLKIQLNDVVWVVGEENLLNELFEVFS